MGPLFRAGPPHLSDAHALGRPRRAEAGDFWDVVGGVLNPVGGVLSATGATGPLADLLKGNPLLAAADVLDKSGIDPAVANTLRGVSTAIVNVAEDPGTWLTAIQTAISFVPGFGQIASAAIAVGRALAAGKPISDALIDGVAGAMPGGPIVQSAVRGGARFAEELAEGKHFGDAALDAARSALPADVRPAFDVGLALAHGKSLQEIALTAARALGPIVFPALLPKIEALGQVALDTAKAQLPEDVRRAAMALLQNPQFRSLPIVDLAARLSTSQNAVKDAIASLTEGVNRLANGQEPTLSLAPNTSARLNGLSSFDESLSKYTQHVVDVGTTLTLTKLPVTTHYVAPPPAPGQGTTLTLTKLPVVTVLAGKNPVPPSPPPNAGVRGAPTSSSSGGSTLLLVAAAAAVAFLAFGKGLG